MLLKKQLKKEKKTFKGDFSKSVPGGPGQVTAGKLEFSTMKKEDVAKKIARQKRDEERATGKKSKAVYEKSNWN